MQVYKPKRICYLNGLYKRCKNVCDYNITFKRIDDIIKGIKCNFIEQNY